MKVIAVLALIFAASDAAITSKRCEDCIKFGTAIQRHLMSEISVNEQVAHFVISLCPGAEDVAQCKEGIPTYWPAFAAAMYPVLLEAESVCGQIGACKKNAFQQVVEPTCDQCTKGLAAVAKVIGSEGKIVEMVNFLKGDGYCAAAGDEKCGDAVDMLIPAAMPVLAEDLVVGSAHYCCDFSTSGVCCAVLDH